MTTRVITHDEAVRAGRRMFGERATLDVESLADHLSVSRATLYRVSGGRDRLLGDVLWSYAAPLHAAAREATTQQGEERPLETLRRFGGSILAIDQFRSFLRAEPDVAIRVLLTPVGDVHRRFVAANRALLATCVDEGHVTTSFGLDDLAYLFSRIYESMWYADLLSGREADLEVAERAARAVLRSG